MVYDGILLGLIVGLVRGGFLQGLSGLSRMKLRAGWIFPILLVLQILVYIGQGKSEWLYNASGYIFMSVYAAGIIFLWINRGQVGFKILMSGVFMNFVVMLANGGKMPVSREMVAISDPAALPMLEQGISGTKHIMMTESSRFPLLGDVIPITSPYPLPQVISVGDIVMNVGIFLFLVHLLSSQSKENPSST
jgi:hypothetical protein